jgi:hypothetical protein
VPLTAALVEPARRGDPRPFTAATGGLGLGSALEATWCQHALDPRLEASCPAEQRPVPGILPYCPAETMGVSSFPPIDPIGPAP